MIWKRAITLCHGLIVVQKRDKADYVGNQPCGTENADFMAARARQARSMDAINSGSSPRRRWKPDGNL
jgi:hypothetical protein